MILMPSWLHSETVKLAVVSIFGLIMLICFIQKRFFEMSLAHQKDVTFDAGLAVTAIRKGCAKDPAAPPGTGKWVV